MHTLGNYDKGISSMHCRIITHPLAHLGSLILWHTLARSSFGAPCSFTWETHTQHALIHTLANQDQVACRIPLLNGHSSFDVPHLSLSKSWLTHLLAYPTRARRTLLSSTHTQAKSSPLRSLKTKARAPLRSARWLRSNTT